jgi:hypothetical protein
MTNNPLTTNPALITVRDNILARADVILVEPFDPARSNGITEPERFAGRITLRDGNTILTDQTPALFAAEHGFHYLGKPDYVATNPDITFRTQKFNLARAQQRNTSFRPERDFATRLIWGRGGPNESKLLENDIETVSAVLLLGQPDRSELSSSRPRPAPEPA